MIFAREGLRNDGPTLSSFCGRTSSSQIGGVGRSPLLLWEFASMAENSKSGFSLKDQLFNEERVRFLASQFGRASRRFDQELFVSQVMQELKRLELKQRIVHIAEVLERHLPTSFPKAAELLITALPPELDPNLEDDDFGDFIIAPLGEFVVRNGLSSEHIDLSLATIREITKRFSMEDAIRSFLNQHPKRTLETLGKWARDPHYHVRRLVSEGTRPRLPWSARLSIEPTAPLPFLDRLHADPTRYVTRSVANHLNDLTKTDATLVLETLSRWRELKKQDPKELDWMTRHALRTLIKQGDRATMEFLGLRAEPTVSVGRIKLLRREIAFGEALEFEVSITAERDEELIVDYVIDFVKANGSTAPKVFKAKKLSLKQGERVTIAKRHPLRADATTYRLFPGTHGLTIQVNGQGMSRATFELREPS